MTAANIQESLIQRLHDILKDFPLNLPYNDISPFKIFKHKIPERLNKMFDYSKKDTHDEVYPFCIVKIDTGEKKSNADMEKTTFNIIVGIKNEGLEGEGYDDVMACIQAIWNNFNENPLLERKYKFEYPLIWALDDEDSDTHPFYYGVIQVQFKSNSMQYVGGNIHGESRQIYR